MAAKKKKGRKAELMNRNQRKQLRQLEAEMGPPVNRIPPSKKKQKSRTMIWPK